MESRGLDAIRGIFVRRRLHSGPEWSASDANPFEATAWKKEPQFLPGFEKVVTQLEAQMENIVKALTPRHKADIDEIRPLLAGVPILNRITLSDIEIELLWEAFSRDCCASYLTVSSSTLANFLQWVRE
jgi:hypothetical protein